MFFQGHSFPDLGNLARYSVWRVQVVAAMILVLAASERAGGPGDTARLPRETFCLVHLVDLWNRGTWRAGDPGDTARLPRETFCLVNVVEFWSRGT